MLLNHCHSIHTHTHTCAQGGLMCILLQKDCVSPWRTEPSDRELHLTLPFPHCIISPDCDCFQKTSYGFHYGLFTPFLFISAFHLSADTTHLFNALGALHDSILGTVFTVLLNNSWKVSLTAQRHYNMYVFVLSISCAAVVLVVARKGGIIGLVFWPG